MLAIRLTRMGSKKKPFFRVVVTEASSARDGSFLEVLGHYNPRHVPATLEVDRDRVQHWVGAGAIMSDTVRTLLAKHVVAAAPPVDAGSTAGDGTSV